MVVFFPLITIALLRADVKRPASVSGQPGDG